MKKDSHLEKEPITKRVLIQASPDIVYKALTDEHDLTRWFCDRATSDPREGGELSAFWRSGKTGIKGLARFTRLIPARCVELIWVDEGGGPVENVHHVFRYSIQHRHGTTEVALCDENGAPLDEESLTGLSEGWNYVLQDLKDFCERRERAEKSRHAEEE
jgi:uncharacterized protein YndB with AHSA1/START domain